MIRSLCFTFLCWALLFATSFGLLGCDADGPNLEQACCPEDSLIDGRFAIAETEGDISLVSADTSGERVGIHSSYSGNSNLAFTYVTPDEKTTTITTNEQGQPQTIVIGDTILVMGGYTDDSLGIALVLPGQQNIRTARIAHPQGQEVPSNADVHWRGRGTLQQANANFISNASQLGEVGTYALCAISVAGTASTGGVALPALGPVGAATCGRSLFTFLKDTYDWDVSTIESSEAAFAGDLLAGGFECLTGGNKALACTEGLVQLIEAYSKTNQNVFEKNSARVEEAQDLVDSQPGGSDRSEDDNSNDDEGDGMDPLKPRMLSNGSFEEGDDGWTLSSSEIIRTGENEAHVGDRYVALGSDERTRDSLYQTVEIPEYVDEATFSYWVNITAASAEGDPADNLSVQIRSPDEEFLQSVDFYNGSSQQTTPEYIREEFDISEYAGEEIRVYFRSYTDGDMHSTSFHIDEVEIE